MKTHEQGPGVLCMVLLLHHRGPDLSGCSEFGYLFEEVHSTVEEKGKPWGEGVYRQPGRYTKINVCETVCKCESELLQGVRASLPYVIPAYAYVIPERHLTR